jgi:hypothetical protein
MVGRSARPSNVGLLGTAAIISVRGERSKPRLPSLARLGWYDGTIDALRAFATRPEHHNCEACEGDEAKVGRVASVSQR